ncbi:MAG: hypothetical protein KC417_14795, partial [Myxococcales bacterium]|nr:hypothetical protein [Myxococcales bacterium]
ECPQDDCKRYFKVTPGTGLKGISTCRCPYCGHEGPSKTFFTRAQIDHALSVVKNKVVGAFLKDMKAMEFNHRGGGIGLSMKVHGQPPPIRGYSEQDLETESLCDACSLRYAIYGVFGFCPDCGAHNNLSILDANMRVVAKMLSLAATVDAEVATSLVENALEDCVSAFDGWGRAVCEVFAAKAADPAKAGKISFQNVMRAQEALKIHFGFDADVVLGLEAVAVLHRAFQKRHLLAHRLGVVDDDYLRQTGDPTIRHGCRIGISASEVEATAAGVRAWAEALNAHLGRLP